MNDDPQRSAREASGSRSPEERAAQSDSGTASRRGFAFQFGLIELFGLVTSFAIWYFVLMSRSAHEPSRPNYGPPPPPPLPASPADRYAATLCSTLVSIGGSYLACRLATKRGVTSVYGRLLIQAGFVFFIVPILVIVAGFVFVFCLVPFQ